MTISTTEIIAQQKKQQEQQRWLQRQWKQLHDKNNYNYDEVSTQKTITLLKAKSQTATSTIFIFSISLYLACNYRIAVWLIVKACGLQLDALPPNAPASLWFESTHHGSLFQGLTLSPTLPPHPHFCCCSLCCCNDFDNNRTNSNYFSNARTGTESNYHNSNNNDNQSKYRNK